MLNFEWTLNFSSEEIQTPRVFFFQFLIFASHRIRSVISSLVRMLYYTSPSPSPSPSYLAQHGFTLWKTAWGPFNFLHFFVLQLMSSPYRYYKKRTFPSALTFYTRHQLHHFVASAWYVHLAIAWRFNFFCRGFFVFCRGYVFRLINFF